MARKKPEKPSNKQKRAIRLNGSDEVLFWPDGTTEIDVLERILISAEERRLAQSRLILISSRERVGNFNVDNPRYKTTEHRYSVGVLQRMYMRMTGREKPASLEELKESLLNPPYRKCNQ